MQKDKEDKLPIKITGEFSSLRKYALAKNNNAIVEKCNIAKSEGSIIKVKKKVITITQNPKFDILDQKVKAKFRFWNEFAKSSNKHPYNFKRTIMQLVTKLDKWLELLGLKIDITEL